MPAAMLAWAWAVSEQAIGGAAAQVPNLDLDILATIDEKVHAGTERPYAMFDWQRPRGQEGAPAIDISA